MVINTKSVLNQISSLERHLNRLRVIPATNRLRTAVILPLLSKALTVSRAVCVLVDAGYRAEAFGLSRTVIEILFIVSYISNKDTERRARRYRDYDARARVEFRKIAEKYAPNALAGTRQLDASVLQLASQYDKHSWLGRGQMATMAKDENAVEFDKSGKGITIEFEYEALYFWTSQYVHATVVGIRGHATHAGEVFKVRADPDEDSGLDTSALQNVIVSLSQLFIYACRAMNEDQPKGIHELFKLIARTTRRKKRRN
jgi:Family of unknown function (DUF5677)